MNSKILVFTDNHFAQYSSIVRNRGDKYSVRLENQIKSLNWITELAEERGCKMIICAGDFFDKSELNAEELTALQDTKWSTSIPYYFIVGNHEMGMNDLSTSSAHLLKMVPNARVIDKPYIDSGFGYELIMLPYVLESNRKPLKDYIDELENDYWQNMWTTQEVKHRVIISHNDISGIRYGQYESKIGFNIEEVNNCCDLYINGHLHNQQQINKKILNLGNLTGQNFSEDAEKFSHCAAIVDLENLNVELIDNPYALNFYKFDILSRDDFSNLDKCKEGAVLSIKTYQPLLADLKIAVAENKNIVSSRFITLPELDKLDSPEQTNFMKLDHIDQFKKFIVENIDNTELLNEELDLLVR